MGYRKRSAAIIAERFPKRMKPSNDPEPFAGRMRKREKKLLGDFFGLKDFGVNLTTPAPGEESALMHAHCRQDEMILVLEGEPTLMTETNVTVPAPGMCVGFPAGGDAHHLVNRTRQDVVILEIGDRTAGDEATYPGDDIHAVLAEEGRWQFPRKNGTPYPGSGATD